MERLLQEPFFRQPVGRALRCLICFSLLPLLSGCAGNVSAPVASRDLATAPAGKVLKKEKRVTSRRFVRPANHRVQKGETLYAIAWRYRLDYRTLARWNGVRPPYLIYPGQVLRLAPPVTPARHLGRAGKPGARPRTDGAGTRPSGRDRQKDAEPVTKVKEARERVPEGRRERLKWIWPAQGKVVPTRAALGAKGIDIYGRLGQSVRAAEDGEVVYSGSGLIGYGKLVIIKHNDEFLSAYAHNQTLLVKEGEQVKRGQQIATMGQSGTERVKLHFEIRKDGKPVPPLRYLPAPR
ncbi:MAG: LysM peptidoglycan-binding domain-containing protein [Gammaproteobacteria bacterium]|nr:MAG: LysM peptidoglycan-binding domain-containing protein [Gammaproteobacteria bacterium]